VVRVVSAAQAKAVTATLRAASEAVHIIGSITPQGDGAQVVVS